MRKVLEISQDSTHYSQMICFSFGKLWKKMIRVTMKGRACSAEEFGKMNAEGGHYKSRTGISSRKRKHLFKLKDNVGTRTNEHKLVMNKFRTGIASRFPNSRITMFCNRFPVRTVETATTNPKLLLRWT